jgi:hypothetical protein
MWVTIKISNQSLGMWDVLVVDPAGNAVTLFGDRKVAAPNVYFEASADGDYQITVANLSLAPGNDEVSYEGTRKKKI